MGPDLRILVDDDSARVYRRGDKVTGRVVLGLESEEDIAALKISFLGTCTTTTTRPVYTPHEADVTQSMQRYQERVQLFQFEQDLLAECMLAPNKESWTFDFKFPELTSLRFSRWQHGSKYLKSSHPLPPSFQTNTSGGQAVISYFLRATLLRGGTQDPIETQELLPYHPTPEDIQLEPKIHLRVLYAQIWKPLSESRTPFDKALSKLSCRNSARSNGPRIVPTLHHPEMIAPGQNIPLYISLEDTQPAPQQPVSQCILDSLTVKISTHTTSMCGQSASAPEDIMVRHVTCLSKTNMAKPLPFGTKHKLANNFRLVDDAECVPSFKTYTITRRYDLNVSIGLKYEGRDFTIRCRTLLEILPRIPRELMPTMPEDEVAEIDPLPLYKPREPSREFAPHYESLYELERGSSSEASLVYTRSRGSSWMSNVSTPASEMEEMGFEERPIQDP
ncbi:hypothetical protein BU23DRAFT_534382 [Bimuria novae-zelandiae CBS 107.79]|uniref:Arrestin-like N-terminal domain-containing protein n=1 Tax=Bimuria novae-zelandiae CBS 107.79 TaxID=1447943 RepID=A0A6A5V724_9PLEO|nr:hypothetical protein BU23DRAFT_534382 [Bimuria novae-zelandiae CBS 107.79]